VEQKKNFLGRAFHVSIRGMDRAIASRRLPGRAAGTAAPRARARDTC
jgi:hypothetical protein